MSDLFVKICRKCSTEQSLANFCKDRSRPDGLNSKCRTCARAQAKAWEQRNPGVTTRSSKRFRAKNPQYMQAWHLKNKYGITLEQYETMWTGQEGCCAICRIELKRAALRQADQACLDHCHATGRIRGILCNRCNLLLGIVQDDPNFLDRLSAYLGMVVA